MHQAVQSSQVASPCKPSLSPSSPACWPCVHPRINCIHFSRTEPSFSSLGVALRRAIRIARCSVRIRSVRIRIRSFFLCVERTLARALPSAFLTLLPFARFLARASHAYFARPVLFIVPPFCSVRAWALLLTRRCLQHCFPLLLHGFRVLADADASCVESSRVALS